MATADGASALLGEAWEALALALEAAGAALGASADLAAETIGLLLEPNLARWSYDSTPSGSLTFASTGGDGVHFSVLTDVGRPGPIVMTVPMNFDEPNVVVGADLRDFLSLGCHFGYFALEQLVYDRERTIREIQAAAIAMPNNDEAVVLATLRDCLGLQAPPNIARHLDALSERFRIYVTEDR